jgi:hypothetical protein
MNITPKNIYKGRNSDGSTFRMEEWDFATLSNMELGGFAIAFVTCMALISIISPLLTILAVLAFSGRFNLMNVLAILFGGYFLYDCSHGWLGIVCLNLFASEATINLFVKLNIASIVISSVLLIFGGVIGSMMANSRNAFLFYLFIAVLFVGSFMLGGSVIPKDKGWVKRNIDYVSPEKKAKARQDSIKRALGDFNSQAERDAYFNEMERRYGN